MKENKKNSIVIALAVSLTLSLLGPTKAFATTPSLGMAATYGVLANTYTNTTVTTINGDVGFTTGPATVPGGVHANYGSGSPYAAAGVDQGTALSSLASQGCTFTFPAGPVDLATDISHGPIGIYTPGVYCTATGAAASIGAGGITLNGSGTYIFRVNGALTTVANSVVTLTGASACDVFWTPSAATTLGATSTFKGTNIDASGITVGANTNWLGRALAFGGTVTTDTTTLTVPTCSAPSLVGQPTSPTFGNPTINVIKRVINANHGTKIISDFHLFVNGLPVVSGVTNNYAVGIYIISETPDRGYIPTFSGDCDLNGRLNLNSGDNKLCIITNNDIGAPVVPPVPPLIDVVKVPNPLVLPGGPGQVTYTYTLRNIGTVPVTNLTMVDDSCSAVTFVSGDTNGNSMLDINEVWTYRCSTTLSATHTNIVVANGWANGISATAIATATVVVGVPIVPPLIHVTKVPSQLTLPAGGGMEIYTEKITNPGTVALSNVTLTDDKCSPMSYLSGDTNGNLMLDPNETWTYNCQTNLTQTTTNTAVATGQANGLTVRDFAIVTVPVAAIPALPNTGFGPTAKTPALPLVAAGLLVLSLFFYIIRKKQTD